MAQGFHVCEYFRAQRTDTMLFLLPPHDGGAAPPRFQPSGLQAAHPRWRQGDPLKSQRETCVSRRRECVNMSRELPVTASGLAPSPGYERTWVYLGVFRVRLQSFDVLIPSRVTESSKVGLRPEQVRRGLLKPSR